MKQVFLSAVLLMASTSAIAGPADHDSGARTEQVNFADLDLGSAAARATLQGRISAAADRVCDLGGTLRLDDFGASARCYRHAMADGRKQMNEIIAARVGGTIMAASALVVSGR